MDMNIDNLYCAFAVNELNQLQNRHFGDAEKYIIYKWIENQFIKTEELINIYKDFDESELHGSKKKGGAIINYLKQKEVKVLVSKQFGKNISLVNQHFIPILVYNNSIEDTMLELAKHFKWIEEELNNKKSNYIVFSINKGILKRKIDKI